jgi:hypothetical protein
MIVLQSIGVLLCVVLLAASAVAIPLARRLDRLDECHLLHGPDSGCVECEDK